MERRGRRWHRLLNIKKIKINCGWKVDNKINTHLIHVNVKPSKNVPIDSFRLGIILHLTKMTCILNIYLRRGLHCI